MKNPDGTYTGSVAGWYALGLEVDMGDPVAAQANAGAVATRMALPVGVPSYMPVTRDLSPTKAGMVAEFMAKWVAG